jgi:hypothetical protein
MRGLQDPNQSNVANLNNVRRLASRHFRITEKEYLKPKSMNLKLKIRYKISETCIGASMTSTRVISLELRVI